MASRGAALPGRSHEAHRELDRRDSGEVPQTDGELTAAEAAEKPPGPAPQWRSLVLLLAGASSLCVVGALVWWVGSEPATVGQYVFGRPASGGHRGQPVFPKMSLASKGKSEGCAGYHEGCLESRCCTEPDEECFQKDNWWAQCLKTCLDTDGDPWDCEVLGTKAATKVNGTLPGAASTTKAEAKGDPSCAWKGENCLDSKCCADPGHRCYVKEEGFAGCRQVCEEGMRDPDGPDDTPWSCADPADVEEEGPEEPGENGTEMAEAERKRKEENEKHRRVKLQPCSWIGENCNASKCCNDPGMMCYAKNDYWAECLEVCEAGENDTAGPDKLPWSCAELGMRTAATEKETQGKVGVCTMRGEDCSQAKCCEDEGFRCYEKNASFSGCRAECKAGLYDPTGSDWLPWTCIAKSPTNPVVSKAKASEKADVAEDMFGVALAAIQEEVEEMNIKEAMARDAVG